MLLMLSKDVLTSLSNLFNQRKYLFNDRGYLQDLLYQMFQ